jgi:membrane-associated phospholipid phosphatase
LTEERRRKKGWFRTSCQGFIVPAALGSSGVFAQGNGGLQRLNRSTHAEVTRRFRERIFVDDYMQYVPSLAVYGLDWLGVRAKHTFRDRFFVMAASYLFMSASVQAVKRTTRVRRPDESDRYSFPSGHTATGFVGAHILFREYRERSPWIAVAGYVLAGGTGVMRITNRKHWLSDVVTGAGVGILCVEVSYLLLPVFHRLLGVEESRKSVVFAPVVGEDNYGVGMAYRF